MLAARARMPSMFRADWGWRLSGRLDASAREGTDARRLPSGGIDSRLELAASASATASKTRSEAPLNPSSPPQRFRAMMLDHVHVALRSAPRLPLRPPRTRRLRRQPRELLRARRA